MAQIYRREHGLMKGRNKMETGLTSMEILGVVLVLILTAVEIICCVKLIAIYKMHVEQRRAANLAALRRKAYNEVKERRQLKNAREKLFNSIAKGDI